MGQRTGKKSRGRRGGRGRNGGPPKPLTEQNPVAAPPPPRPLPKVQV